jgi:hypothetical protein
MNWRPKIVRVRRRLFEAGDSLRTAETERKRRATRNVKAAKAVLIYSGIK